MLSNVQHFVLIAIDYLIPLKRLNALTEHFMACNNINEEMNFHYDAQSPQSESAKEKEN